MMDVEIRMECARLAVQINPHNWAEVALELYQFITAQTPAEAPDPAE